MAKSDFAIETVAWRVRELASLLPGLATSFSCERQEYGPASTMAELLETRDHGRLRHARPILGEAREAETVARVAFQWRHWPVQPTIVGYCNLEVTPRGAHLEGFQHGLAKGLGRRDHRRVLDALSGGLHAVVSVLVVDPTYEGPTKDRLVSSTAREVVRDATARALSCELASDPELARLVAERLEP